MPYTDIAGRINSANLTEKEMDFLESIADRKWFIPTDEEWLLMRGVLALVDIRRGYELHSKPSVYVQLGVAQIQINHLGLETVKCIKAGKHFVYGEALSWVAVAELIGNDGIGIKAK